MTRSQHSRRDFLKKSVRRRPPAARRPISLGARRRLPTPRPTTGRGSAASARATRYTGRSAPNIARFGDIVAVCDVDSRHADRAKNDPEDRQRQGRRLRRLPQGARPQRHRRGEHRHARPLAREDRHRGPAGRQARLLREAADAHARREPTDPQRLQEVQQGFHRRHAAAEHGRPVPPRRQHGAEGAVGRHQEDHRGHRRQPHRRTVPQGRPAQGTRLGLLARPGAEGRLHQRALPLQFPLVVRVLGRQVHRLGRPPRRHRHLGHRARPGRHGADRDRRRRRQASRCPSRTAIRPWTTATTRRTISPSSASSPTASR